MTRYEQGFMNKCAEHGVPEHVAGQMLNRIGTMRKSAQAKESHWLGVIGRTMHNSDTKLHQPIEPYTFLNSAPDDWDHPYKGSMTLGQSCRIADRELPPGMRQAVDLATQTDIDALPDPGPNVRQPTPYELYQYSLAYKNSKNKPKGGIFERLPSGGSIFEMLPHQKPEMTRELVRRMWNSATNAIPISATSPTPVR